MKSGKVSIKKLITVMFGIILIKAMFLSLYQSLDSTQWQTFILAIPESAGTPEMAGIQ